MCSPSSSVEGSPYGDADRQCPETLPGAEQFIAHHVHLLDPAAAWFVRTLWSQAAFRAYQDSVELLNYAHRYSPHRLERACQFALFHNLNTLPALRLVFAEDLDRLPCRPDAEPTGQLLLPLPGLHP